MRSLMLILSFTVIFVAAVAAQAEKTLVKSINLNGYAEITAALKGKTVVSEWDKDFIRLTVKIELSNSTAAVLEKLVTAGRYEIEAAEDNAGLIISMPKILKTIQLKGTTLDEVFSFELSVPKNTAVKIECPDSEGI